MSSAANTSFVAVYSPGRTDALDDDEEADEDDDYYSVSSSSSDEGYAYSCVYGSDSGAAANPVRTVNVALYRSNTLIGVCKLSGTIGTRSYNMFMFLQRNTAAHDVHFSPSDISLLINPVLYNSGPDSVDAHANCITVQRSGWHALATFIGSDPDDADVAAAPPSQHLSAAAVAAPAPATHRTLQRVHSCW